MRRFVVKSGRELQPGADSLSKYNWEPTSCRFDRLNKESHRAHPGFASPLPQSDGAVRMDANRPKMLHLIHGDNRKRDSPRAEFPRWHAEALQSSGAVFAKHRVGQKPKWP